MLDLGDHSTRYLLNTLDVLLGSREMQSFPTQSFQSGGEGSQFISSEICLSWDMSSGDAWLTKNPNSNFKLMPLLHRQRRLVGCSPWDHKEWDMTEHAGTHAVTVSLWNSSPWLVLMEPTTPMTVWQTGFRLGNQLESLGSSYLEHWVQKKSEAKSRFSGKECRSRLVMAYSLYFSTSFLI